MAERGMMPLVKQLPKVLARAAMGTVNLIVAGTGALGAAALQFPFGHPAVSSVIPGPNAPEQVRGNLGWMRHEIPTDLWDDLKGHGLIRPDALGFRGPAAGCGPGPPSDPAGLPRRHLRASRGGTLAHRLHRQVALVWRRRGGWAWPTGRPSGL